MRNRARAAERDGRAAKVARLRAGDPPRVLDLFAGCGGMSLGFAREGFAVAGAVELDPLAARSHALNFHRDADPAAFPARDITATDPDDLGLGPVDVVVGGPPCQSYARVGRAKLR